MRLMSIASGSGGNAAYVGNDHTHLLIDSGVSRKRILDGLKRLDLSLNDITAILVTHEHSDHICSLGVIERTRSIPVYATGGTVRGILKSGILSPEKDIFNTISAGDEFIINDITVTAINISHDANEPVCYRFEDKASACAIVTDLGFFDKRTTDSLQNLDAAIIEANHDIRMLETGPYPYPLKMRIAGNTGHLSNEDSGKLISGILHDRMEYIALGHLSRKNNYSQLAKLTVEEQINAGNKYSSRDFRIDVADQEKGTDIYEF